MAAELARTRAHRIHHSTEPVSYAQSDAVIPDDELLVLRGFQRASSAVNTFRGYATDWTQFQDWCQLKRVDPLPADPKQVARYIANAAALVDEDGEFEYAPGTLARWVASINKAHFLNGFPKPGEHAEVATTLSGIRRLRAEPPRRKTPLLLDDLRRTVDAIPKNVYPQSIIGHRDSALLIMGFVGAFRSDELANLQLRDVVFHDQDGLYVRMRKSKSDQMARGNTKALPRGGSTNSCAPCAYVRWLKVMAAQREGRAAILDTILTSDWDQHVCERGFLPDMKQFARTAPVFRPVMKNGSIKLTPITSQVVNKMLQRRVAAIGLDPALYGSHSLRAGFVTQALRDHATVHQIMGQTLHRNPATVEIYARENNPLADNAVNAIRL